MAVVDRFVVLFFLGFYNEW